MDNITEAQITERSVTLENLVPSIMFFFLTLIKLHIRWELHCGVLRSDVLQNVLQDQVSHNNTVWTADQRLGWKARHPDINKW